MTKPLPDIVAPGLSVVFCGLNPGLSAATEGHHFVGRSNRFWRVLHLAGFTPHLIAAEDDASLLTYGLGVTSVVEPFGGAVAWVRPNPCGRNLAFSQDALVAAYREPRLTVESST